MSRFHPSTSYNHRIRRLDPECFRLSWTVDRYYDGSRQRFPTVYTRDTDERGARRFSRRWGCAVPGDVPSS